MSAETKTARPSVAAPERAKTGADRADLSSRVQYTPGGYTNQEAPRIADLLLPGKENAVSRKDLAAATGLPDRTIRRMVEAERRSGLPILSDCETSGYYLPSCQTETEAFVESLRRRAAQIMLTATMVEDAIRGDTF